MADTSGQFQKPGTYVINAESGTEMARLMHQDRIITEQLGGIFPPAIDLTHVNDILDVACGPGGWALELAHLHPQINIHAFDCSQIMIEYAQAQARTQKLTNLHFKVANAIEPLTYAENSFDIINARYIVGFMAKNSWSGFTRECARILRPGGLLCLTEAEPIMSNSAAAERLVELMSYAGMLSGRTFSPNGRNFGILQMLSFFLRKNGFQDIQNHAYAIDVSTASTAHESSYQNFLVVTKLLQPFMVNAGVITDEEFEKLYQRAIAEMMLDDFCGIWFNLSVWGIAKSYESLALPTGGLTCF